jgi:hypothetical protein
VSPVEAVLTQIEAQEHRRFLKSHLPLDFKGANEQWRGIFRDEDLALYDATVQAMFSPECAKWVASGRLESCDPT